MIKLIICIVLIFQIQHPVDEYCYVPKAKTYQSPHDFEPQLMRVTCYLPTGNHTASGCYPFIGSCAGRREDIGKVIALYDINKNFIGYVEVRDTGGAQSIKNGTSIDIYVENMEQARAWVAEYGDYMYCQYIEANG